MSAPLPLGHHYYNPDGLGQCLWCAIMEEPHSPPSACRPCGRPRAEHDWRCTCGTPVVGNCSCVFSPRADHEPAPATVNGEGRGDIELRALTLRSARREPAPGSRFCGYPLYTHGTPKWCAELKPCSRPGHEPVPEPTPTHFSPDGPEPRLHREECGEPWPCAECIDVYRALTTEPTPEPLVHAVIPDRMTVPPCLRCATSRQRVAWTSQPVVLQAALADSEARVRADEREAFAPLVAAVHRYLCAAGAAEVMPAFKSLFLAHQEWCARVGQQ